MRRPASLLYALLFVLAVALAPAVPMHGAFPGANEKIAFALDRYPRPRTATPLRVPLVPAFAKCTSPNTRHAQPLDLPACEPPQTGSKELTVSTQGHGSAWARYAVVVGDPTTAADEADVRISAVASDVRTKMGSDYGGKVILSASMRFTDTANGFGGVAGTLEDFRFSVPAGCVGTLGPIGGSACGIDTTADALVPDFAREGTRALISLQSVELLDAGADGDVGTAPDCPPKCGTGDEGVFLRQGVFAP